MGPLTTFTRLEWGTIPRSLDWDRAPYDVHRIGMGPLTTFTGWDGAPYDVHWMGWGPLPRSLDRMGPFTTRTELNLLSQHCCHAAQPLNVRSLSFLFIVLAISFLRNDDAVERHM